MDESDELLIESVLSIVNAARRRPDNREDIPRELEASVYRLYWLSISDLGAGAGRVQCECPMCGDRMMVPAFVKRFMAGEPRVVQVKASGAQDVFEDFGYLSLLEGSRLHKAYSQLVLAAKDEIDQADPCSRYVEIEARVCSLMDLGGPFDKGLGKRIYAARLKPGELDEIKLV
jgi:hypothetical protein